MPKPFQATWTKDSELSRSARIAYFSESLSKYSRAFERSP